MEPGAYRDDVPGPAAGPRTDTPGSVFEGSAMAPMRREPSLSRRKPRAAATGPPAGSLFLARGERHFLLTVGLGTPRCARSARATDAREVFLSRAREQQGKIEVANEEDVGSDCRLLLGVRRPGESSLPLLGGDHSALASVCK